MVKRLNFDKSYKCEFFNAINNTAFVKFTESRTESGTESGTIWHLIVRTC